MAPTALVLRWLLVGVILLAPLPSLAAELQRIQVIETNNYRLRLGYLGMDLPTSLQDVSFVALRRHTGPLLLPEPKTEQDAFRQLTAWVHGRWQHDPFGMARPGASALEILRSAERGARYSCVEYSRVLRDLMVAHGYVARTVNLQSAGIGYGGLGSAHVAVEAWSNDLSKWIFLDAQWGVAALHKGQPINIAEIVQLQRDGRFDEVEFRSVLGASAGPGNTKAKQLNAAYRTFLAPYLGYMSVNLLTDQEKVSVLLALNGKDWPLTFQGLPRNAQIFSTDADDLYFDINRVSLVLHYRPEAQPLNRTPIEFGSQADYLAKMPQFAAVPDFVVHPHHNMPWFSYFEYAVDNGPWRRMDGEEIAWALRQGDNRLSVRAVNKAGRSGPVTFLRIRYGEPSPRR